MAADSKVASEDLLVYSPHLPTTFAKLSPRSLSVMINVGYAALYKTFFGCALLLRRRLHIYSAVGVLIWTFAFQGTAKMDG